MNLDRALQFNTAALAVMGALFLGLGHESVVLPLSLAIAALASVTLASRFRWLRLNRWVANALALAAVLWSLRKFFGNVGSEGQLLAIADMLVFLQIVLLFQEKTGRVYWQLIVLSLLQVVVAAALNLGPQFGMLLAAYVALALSALVLLCLYREWKKYTPGSLAPTRAAAVGPAWQSLLAAPAVSLPHAAEFAVGARPSTLARQVAIMGIATVVFAGVFFYATPRLRDGAWADMRGGTHANSGFAAEAPLEEFGRIHQSNHLVMRVTLSKFVDRRPYPLMSDPYFHGLALTEYAHDHAGGRWVVGRVPRISPQIKLSPALPSAVAMSNLVRQDIMLEGGSVQLFAILPLSESPSGIDVRPFSGRILRQSTPGEVHSRREFRYSLATTSLRNGRQLHGNPHRNPVLTVDDQTILDAERELLLRIDRERFGKLAALADEIVRESGVNESSALDQALALERHFHAPGRYRYSLNLDFARDKKIDPIEDFVANHRTGHCEYFASALVLMLRSRGIPARLVMGYKGGDFNLIGSYYQVRQKHAHAWVEALIPAPSVPSWELAGGTTPTGNVWYRLDPTPSSLQFATEENDAGLVDRAMQTFDYVELLWRDYVLSLNAAKQEDTVYEPVSARALGALPRWLESRRMRQLWRWLSTWVGMDLEPRSDRDVAVSRVVDWRIGTLAVTSILLVLAAAHAVYLLWRVLQSWRIDGGLRAGKKGRGPPQFYRRLEALLSRLHVRRAAGQTAREFAGDAADRLNHGDRQSGAARLPAEIVEAYYRVRFGGATLDNSELAAIEHALVQLTPAVNLARQ